ncbi:MAG TPA: hypothetical protein VLX60_03845, partial [Terriglobales bacterium]|nr:hypothetical protein [Terriglobales bacterium]
MWRRIAVFRFRAVLLGSSASRHLILLALSLWLAVLPANAQSPAAGGDKTAEILHQMNGSFENLVKQVSPAVVEVLVTGFGSSEEEEEDSSAPSSIGRERSL